MAAVQKDALKRLMFDLRELQKNPVPGVAATPLEENMFEWHCNILSEGIILHMILFFPDNYPYSAPSAEFVPIGFRYGQGATRDGKKGTQVCLAMFSDYADTHREWKDAKGVGWSPCYTVQTMLMNVVSFLLETKAFSRNTDDFEHNLKIAQCCKCEDCGHTFESPTPRICMDEDCDSKPENTTEENSEMEGCSKLSAGEENPKEPLDTRICAFEKNADMDTCDAEAAFLPDTDAVLDLRRDDSCVDMDVDTTNTVNSSHPQIVDYISKDVLNFQETLSSEDVFGFGLYIGKDQHTGNSLKSPCEFLSARSFYAMQSSVGEVRSVWKELLTIFLPLHMHPSHGANIKSEFEKAMKELSTMLALPKGEETPITEVILEALPSLLFTTSHQFASSGGEAHLLGYFAVHRLFLWAVDTYPDLEEAIEDKINTFLRNAEFRSSMTDADLSNLLLMMGFSGRHKWHDVCEAYLHEKWRVWTDFVVAYHGPLGLTCPGSNDCFQQTMELEVLTKLRKCFAVQLQLLDLTHPTNVSRVEQVKVYDANYGLPTQDMMEKVAEIRARLEEHDWCSFSGWLKLMGAAETSAEEMHQQLHQHVDTTYQQRSKRPQCLTGRWWHLHHDRLADIRRKVKAEAAKRRKDARQAALQEKRNGKVTVKKCLPYKNVRSIMEVPVGVHKGPAFSTRSQAVLLVGMQEEGPAFNTRGRGGQ